MSTFTPPIIPSSFLLNIMLINKLNILGIPAHVITEEKEIKIMQIEKEEIKLSVFAETFYVGNPKAPTKNFKDL